MKVRSKIALKISAINVDRKAAKRLGLNGDVAACNGNQQEGK